jgi:hypothetical protein
MDILFSRRTEAGRFAVQNDELASGIPPVVYGL